MSRGTSFVVMVLTMVSFLSGCGDSAPGTYSLDKAAMKKSLQARIDAERDPDTKSAMQQIGTGMVDEMSMTITLNADGTASGTSNMSGREEKATGTWILNGESISITLAGQGDPMGLTMNGTWKGSTLEMTLPDFGEDMPFKMIFSKQ